MNALIIALLVTSATADARLAVAEDLSKRRETAAAIDAYKSLLADGHDGADLRYNLGTLALDNRDVGLAVLQLKAALKRAPRSEDAKHNLQVALEASTDRLAGEATFDVLRVVGTALSPTAARVAFAVPCALVGVLLGLLGFIDRRRSLVVKMLVTMSVLALLGGAMFAARVSVEGTREVVVQKAEAPALKDPDADATVSFPAHAGLSGIVMDENGAFVRVRFDNGLEAWLKSDDTATVP